MNEYWYFKCLKCNEESCGENLNRGNETLLNVLKHADIIKTLLDSDKTGYIEISLSGHGTEMIDFLMNHYGEGHDVVVYSKY